MRDSMPAMFNQRRMAIHNSVSKTTRKEYKFYNHLEMNPIVWTRTDMENKSVNEVVVYRTDTPTSPFLM